MSELSVENWMAIIGVSIFLSRVYQYSCLAALLLSILNVQWQKKE